MSPLLAFTGRPLGCVVCWFCYSGSRHEELDPSPSRHPGSQRWVTAGRLRQDELRSLLNHLPRGRVSGPAVSIFVLPQRSASLAWGTWPILRTCTVPRSLLEASAHDSCLRKISCCVAAADLTFPSCPNSTAQREDQ